MQILLIIFWMVLSTIAFAQYREFCQGLTFGQLLAVFLVFIIGGPFFAITNILTMILDCIFPEGWDDDDDCFK